MFTPDEEIIIRLNYIIRSVMYAIEEGDLEMLEKLYENMSSITKECAEKYFYTSHEQHTC